MARLKRDNQGRIILPSGEKISKAQEQSFRRAVANANAKRKRLIENLPRPTKEKNFLFSGEKQWLFRKKSQSFARFQNYADFRRYYANIRKVVDKGFIPHQMNLYRENLYKSFVTLFGDEKGGELIKMLQGLTPKEFAQMTLDDTLQNIGFVYDNNISFTARYQAIRNNILQALGRAKEIRPIRDEIDISEYRTEQSTYKRKYTTQSFKGKYGVATGLIKTSNKATLI